MSTQADEITDVIAHPLQQRLPTPTVTAWGRYETVSTVLVEVRTREGYVGVGETLGRFAPRAYAELIHSGIAPRIVGRDPADIAALWQIMRRTLSGRAGGMLIEAIAGIDIALWDIAGKVAGQPIARLLGGMGCDRLDVYAAAVNWVEDAAAERELRAFVEQGFTRIKIKLAGPVDAACRRAEHMRRLAGPGIGLCVDANWGFRLDEAVQVGNALSDNEYFWFEEPLAPEDEQGYEALRARCQVPLAAGESNYTLDQAQRLVASRTLSVLQPDIARSGGFTETRRMADYAAAHGIAYAPHIGMSGIVCETASIHLAAAMPNFRILECECDRSPFKVALADLSPACLRQSGGTVDVPTGPGLGLEIDWDAVRRLTVQ